LRCPMNRSYLNRNLLMLKSEFSRSILKSRTARTGICVLVLSLLALLPAASAQGGDFTLQVTTPFNPFAVDPGQSSASNVTLGTLNGYNGTVDLSCQITSSESPSDPPTCGVSPAVVTPSAGATVTVTTTGTTTAAGYTVTVTGVDSVNANLTHSVAQNLSVLAVTPQFTITVGTTISPSSVHAGSGGQGVITITPIYGYSGSVTPSCSSVTPVVTIPPVCTFNPPTVNVAGVVTTTTLSINTVGPTTKAAVPQRRVFYALCMPMLGLLTLASVVSRRRSRRIWGLLALVVLSGMLLLTPACGNKNTTTTTTTTTGVTPNNTYTFTLSGVDANGISSSNTGTTTSPTVSLTVN
jgi:hypothetical protein